MVMKKYVRNIETLEISYFQETTTKEFAPPERGSKRRQNTAYWVFMKKRLR